MYTVEELNSHIQKAKAGDSSSYEHVYKKLYSPVFAYALSKTKNRETAEDIVQDVFISFLENIQKYQNIYETPLPYLFTIARNKIINLGKKKKDGQITEEMSETLISTEDGQEVSFEKKQLALKINDLIGKLNETESEIIRMIFYSDLSNKEISQILGKTEENVRKIKSRALKNLKNHLEKNER